MALVPLRIAHRNAKNRGRMALTPEEEPVDGHIGLVEAVRLALKALALFRAIASGKSASPLAGLFLVDLVPAAALGITTPTIFLRECPCRRESRRDCGVWYKRNLASLGPGGDANPKADTRPDRQADQRISCDGPLLLRPPLPIPAGGPPPPRPSPRGQRQGVVRDPVEFAVEACGDRHVDAHLGLRRNRL